MAKSKFKDWYSDPANRKKLNDRRKARYHSDKKYRKSVLKHTSNWREKRARATPPVKKTLFSIGEAAELIGCEQKTIRTLEQQELIPVQYEPGQHRRYTKKQIDLIYELVWHRKKVHYRDPKYQPKLDKLSHAAHERW